MFKYKKNNTRIIFKNNEGALNKLFWLYADPKDGSLYYNFYPAASSDGNIRHLKGTGSRFVNWNDMHVKTNFPVDHHAYKKSGYRHVKSKGGIRLEDGMKFVPFDEIKSPIQIAAIAPQSPETYPSINQTEFTSYDLTLDAKWFNNRPFTGELFIIPKSLSLESISSISPKKEPHVDVAFAGEHLGFNFFMRFSPLLGENCVWSKYSLIIDFYKH